MSRGGAAVWAPRNDPADEVQKEAREKLRALG
jgi:hypothetical protein